MALFLLQNLAAISVRATKNLIVAAETAADARIFAATHFNGDSSWADSTATALSEETLDASASMLGYVWKIVISGGTQTEDPIVVTTTGTGTDDLDAIAADLVTALNAHAEIANAAYAAPNLTIAGVADGMGDASVFITVNPPSGNTNADVSFLYGTITHEGIAAAALAVALVADTETKPEVLAEV